MSLFHITTPSRAARVCIAANAALVAAKFSAALLGHSSALMGDAADSAMDVLSALLMLAALRISAQAPDREHPYGHERYENIASVVLAAVMIFGAAGIGMDALRTLFGDSRQAVGPLPLAAALLSAAAKLLLGSVAARWAVRFSSPSLADNARNYKTDSLCSLFAAAGILGSLLGAWYLDPLAGFVICAGILKTALQILFSAADGLVDRACDDETQTRIRAAVLAVPGVLGIKQLLTRRFGNRIYIELEIFADGTESLWQAHATAEQVHDAVEQALPQTKHCTVHVEPKNR